MTRESLQSKLEIVAATFDKLERLSAVIFDAELEREIAETRAEMMRLYYQIQAIYLGGKYDG